VVELSKTVKTSEQLDLMTMLSCNAI
jgi:hypothetical protein